MNSLVVECGDIAFIIRLFKYIILIVRIAVPILLIALITFDLAKAMTQNSDDEMKKATSKIFTRVVWAVAIFFVPLLLRFVFSNLGNTSTKSGLTGPASWLKCYNSIK